MDDDVKNCAQGHVLDRLHIDDVQITSRAQTQYFIDLLENAKKSFKQ